MCPPSNSEAISNSQNDQETPDQLAARIEASDRHLLSFLPVDPKSLKFHELPKGSTQCKLSAVRGGNLVCKGLHFVKDRKEELFFENAVFLVEGAKGKVLFDLGLRKNNEWPSAMLRNACVANQVQCKTDFKDNLQEAGISLDGVNAAILSHHHFDHVGDVRLLPKNAKIIFGPRKTPMDVLGTLQIDQAELGDRKVEFLNESSDWIDVGPFRGVDYWNDGSFYILKAPGHTQEHICALARTSIDPPVFHFLGGDVAHHISLIGSAKGPGSRIGLYPKKNNPFDIPPPPGEEEALQCLAEDIGDALWSMAATGRMDMEPNINVWLAHDPTMWKLIGQRNYYAVDGTMDELQTFKNRDRAC